MRVAVFLYKFCCITFAATEKFVYNTFFAFLLIYIFVDTHDFCTQNFFCRGHFFTLVAHNGESQESLQSCLTRVLYNAYKLFGGQKRQMLVSLAHRIFQELTSCPWQCTCSSSVNHTCHEDYASFQLEFTPISLISNLNHSNLVVL